MYVCDGCGRGRNEFAGRVQNHHVRFSFGTLCVASYAKDAIVGACHRTSDRQEHKIIWRAGPEQDTIFHLCVTACREQGSHCHNERLAWVASRGQGVFVLQLICLKSLGSEVQKS